MVAVIRMALLKHPDSRGVQTMITELLASLDRRFQFVVSEKQLMVATLLDPRFKDRFMPQEVRQSVYEWLAHEVLEVARRNEDQNDIDIPTKRVAVEASHSSQSSVWDAFDQVIQGSLAPTNDEPVTDSVDGDRASLMQMIRVYVAEPTIDRMLDPLKWWAENGIKRLAPVATVLVSTTN